jgi:hypothetical protein
MHADLEEAFESKTTTKKQLRARLRANREAYLMRAREASMQEARARLAIRGLLMVAVASMLAPAGGTVLGAIAMLVWGIACGAFVLFAVKDMDSRRMDDWGKRYRTFKAPVNDKSKEAAANALEAARCKD